MLNNLSLLSLVEETPSVHANSKDMPPTREAFLRWKAKGN